MAGDSHLGKGWRFPVAVNLTGSVASSSLEENVRQSIFVILGTAPGERVKRPKFGCKLQELVFAPCVPLTGALAEKYVTEALFKFEPRIGGVDVDALPNPTEPNRLDIRIRYVLRETNQERNLVYPFYLRDEEEEG